MITVENKHEYSGNISTTTTLIPLSRKIVEEQVFSAATNVVDIMHEYFKEYGR